jgi:hypothetical protein
MAIEKTSLPLRFVYERQNYTGWATPSDDRCANGHAQSYHVVLNEVPLGNLSYQNDRWLLNDQQPNELTVAVGDAITQAESFEQS